MLFRAHVMVLFLTVLLLGSCGGDPRAKLRSPAPDSTLCSSTETFTWHVPNSVGSPELWLDVGTRQGIGDIYAGKQAPGTTEKTVANLPLDGNVVYVRLWTLLPANRLTPFDYTYQTCRK